MHRFTAGLALLAFATTLTAVSPSIAAPTIQYGFNSVTSIDCALPENAYDRTACRRQAPAVAAGRQSRLRQQPNGDRVGMAQPRGLVSSQ